MKEINVIEDMSDHPQALQSSSLEVVKWIAYLVRLECTLSFQKDSCENCDFILIVHDVLIIHDVFLLIYWMGIN